MNESDLYLIYGTDVDFKTSETNIDLLNVAGIVGVIAVICYLFI